MAGRSCGARVAAALLEGDGALAAWDRLAPSIDPRVPDVDSEVFRLLPLVHHNMRRLGVTDTRLDALAPIMRRSWFRTRTIIDNTGPALACLTDAAIPTMVLKGAPLALGYYEHPGLRFLSDVDVLVPNANAEMSLDLLSEAGWRNRSSVSHTRLLRARHSVNLIHESYGNFDLHWRLSMRLVLASDRAHSEDDFWQAAEPIRVAGIDTRTLGPADLLLHVCVHGAWRSSGSTARWVADAVTIIRSAADRLDWDRILDQAQRRRLVVQMRNDLGYLAQEFDAPIPSAVLERLRSMPAGRREARTYRALTREPPPDWVRQRYVVFQGYWLEKTGAIPRWRQVYELPGHVQDYFGLEHKWEIPVELTARVARRARRLLGTPKPVVSE